MNDIRRELGLRPLINLSGTMTALGASIVSGEVAKEMMRILPEFVAIDDLQCKAGEVIAELCGSEAGMVTASCSAGITMSVAGIMAGGSPLRTEQLPDTEGLKNEVLVQAGHLISYGAPVEQAVRLSGAKAHSIGTATLCEPYHLEETINEKTACALYVVSHHCVDYGQLPLSLFAEICHKKGVPVLVDAASEYDLKGFLAQGGDIVLYSGHKFLGGPTSGIIAGTREWIRKIYLQNRGLGRGMKVGKESIVGVMAALKAWEKRDHQAIREQERRYLNLWQKALESFPGVMAVVTPDPTGNPLERLQVFFDTTQAGLSAADFFHALAAADPPVIVRNHEMAKGYIFLDPCNLHGPEEAETACRLMSEILTQHRS